MIGHPDRRIDNDRHQHGNRQSYHDPGNERIDDQIAATALWANQSGATAGAVAASDVAAVIARPREGRGARARTPLPSSSSSVPSCSCAARGGFSDEYSEPLGAKSSSLALRQSNNNARRKRSSCRLRPPAGYAPLDIAGIPAFLSRQPDIAARLDGQPGDWQVSEIGDGNLNLVFLVEGPAGGVCVQAGPALCAACRRELADAAAARLLRARMPQGARPPRRHAAADRLSLRAGPLRNRHGTARAPYHHATGHDPGHRLSAVCRRHRSLPGAVAVLHLRPRSVGSRQEAPNGGLLRQHRALQDHRGSHLHRSLHDP